MDDGINRVVEAIAANVDERIVPTHQRAGIAQRLLDRGSVDSNGRLIGASWLAEISPIVLELTDAAKHRTEPEKFSPGPAVERVDPGRTFAQRCSSYLNRHGRSRKVDEGHLAAQLAETALRESAKLGGNVEPRHDESTFSERLQGWLNRKGR